MGVSLEPVGPLPASTYWRRRAVVGGVLLLLLLLLLRACGGGEDPAPAGDALAPTSAPPTTPTTSAPATSVPASPTTTPPPASATPVAACTAAGGLRIVAATDARRYPQGTTARLSMTITNAGRTACRVGLGQGSLEFGITSGTDRIWSSDDCSPGGPAGEQVLGAGDRRSAELSWSLSRSAPGCPGDRPDVRPGTYTLYARSGDVVSAAATFSVVAAG